MRYLEKSLISWKTVGERILLNIVRMRIEVLHVADDVCVLPSLEFGKTLICSS